MKTIREIRREMRRLNVAMDRFEQSVGSPIQAWFSKRHKKRREALERRLEAIQAACPHTPEKGNPYFCRHCTAEIGQAAAKAGQGGEQ